MILSLLSLSKKSCSFFFGLESDLFKSFSSWENDLHSFKHNASIEKCLFSHMFFRMYDLSNVSLSFPLSYFILYKLKKMTGFAKVKFLFVIS